MTRRRALVGALRAGAKRGLLAGLDLPGGALAARWLLGERAAVFMLHRFAVPDLGVPGDDPEAVRRGLEYLRRRDYRPLPLAELCRQLAAGEPLPPRCVAFTIDDGYFDQAEVAGPLFAEFDVPVTTFVCTGFLDRRLWMWWDRIEHVFRHTPRRELAAPLGGRERRYAWEGEGERRRAQLDFTEACKQVPDAEKHAAIAALARSAEVELPASAPPEYAPMTWDALRRAEAGGMRFGPHTVTHPVLARADDAQARSEIATSLARVRAEASDPESVFCYPNGQPGDFGPRELAILAELGFAAAVVGYPGYASRADFANGGTDRFRVRRFGFPDNLADLAQCAAGIERLKSALRGEA